MKKLFLIVFFVGVGCGTQDLRVRSITSLANPKDDIKITKNGNYAKDINNERDQYVGLWEYNEDKILFRLKIDKDDKALNKIEYNGQISNYNYCDQIILRYRLIKNGVVIYDNLNSTSINNVNAWGVKQASSSELYGRMLDFTRNVMGDYTIIKLSGTPAKIKFNLVLGNYTKLNPTSYYNDGQPLFSIPTGEIEMTKVN